MKNIDWMAHNCESGSDVCSNLHTCIFKAKKFKMRVIFVFNYIHIFEVLPSGKWTCRNTHGIAPILGPNSEFIPKEGWSKFFGH